MGPKSRLRKRSIGVEGVPIGRLLSPEKRRPDAFGYFPNSFGRGVLGTSPIRSSAKVHRVEFGSQEGSFSSVSRLCRVRVEKVRAGTTCVGALSRRRFPPFGRSPRTTLERFQPSGKSRYQLGFAGVGVKALQLVGVDGHVVEFLLPVVPLDVGPLGRP